MVDRAKSRVAFGTPLADQGVVQEHIANSRIEIDQARLQVLHCAWMFDTVEAKDARFDISAIEIFGALGVSDDTPLAYFYSWARALRIVDGPDAVHRRTVTRGELRGIPPHVGC